MLGPGEMGIFFSAGERGLNACAEIAAAFMGDGFRYLKSRQAMVKRELRIRAAREKDPASSETQGRRGK